MGGRRGGKFSRRWCRWVCQSGLHGAARTLHSHACFHPTPPPRPTHPARGRSRCAACAQRGPTTGPTRARCHRWRLHTRKVGGTQVRAGEGSGRRAYSEHGRRQASGCSRLVRRKHSCVVLPRCRQPPAASAMRAPVTTKRAQGSMASALTHAVWPASTRRHCPRSISNARAVPSEEQVSSREPSAINTGGEGRGGEQTRVAARTGHATAARHPAATMSASSHAAPPVPSTKRTGPLPDVMAMSLTGPACPSSSSTQSPMSRSQTRAVPSADAAHTIEGRQGG